LPLISVGNRSADLGLFAEDCFGQCARLRKQCLQVSLHRACLAPHPRFHFLPEVLHGFHFLAGRISEQFFGVQKTSEGQPFRLPVSQQKLPVVEPVERGDMLLACRGIQRQAALVGACRSGRVPGFFLQLSQMGQRQALHFAVSGLFAQRNRRLVRFARLRRLIGARAAIVYVSDQISGNNDLWLYDLRRDLSTRFTFGAGTKNSPVWAPDGSMVYYAVVRNGKNFDLYRKSVSGSGEEELVFGSADNKYPTSFTQDGKLLLYSVKRAPPNSGQSIWVLPFTGDKKPWPVLEGKFDYWSGVVSFDGKWVAYVSNESGRSEVFVTSFPKPGRKWQVSKNGGYIAFWRRDGKEIMYQAPDGRMIGVDVIARGDILEFGAEHPLLQLPTFQEPFCLYSPTSDHQRFLSVSGISAQPKDPMRLVINWPTMLKK